jgi:hypothetical protein
METKSALRKQADAIRHALRHRHCPAHPVAVGLVASCSTDGFIGGFLGGNLLSNRHVCRPAAGEPEERSRPITPCG